MAVNPVPKGYHSITPYLTVTGADKLRDFLKQAFGAEERHCMSRDDGTVWHGEMKIGDSIVMFGEANGPWQPRPSTLYLYVEDTDTVYQRALAAGAASLREPTTEFYGDRCAGVEDPVGNYWWLATHVEDVSPEELARRAAEFKKQQAQQS